MTGRFDSEEFDQDEVLIERYIPCLFSMTQILHITKNHNLGLVAGL
jgi:hypothetical protein